MIGGKEVRLEEHEAWMSHFLRDAITTNFEVILQRRERSITARLKRSKQGIGLLGLTLAPSTLNLGRSFPCSSIPQLFHCRCRPLTYAYACVP